MIEDYRKLSGVYHEQIIARVKPDSLGNFLFAGTNLPEENKMYRIHADTCKESDQNLSHVTGHCENSEEIVFVANNQTTLALPFSFEQEMFCKVVSNNEKTQTFLKIDSLKNDMRYAFSNYRSEANRKVNTEKWFSILQNYGEQLQEPLAELYIYSFLSDRRSILHAYYLSDLKTNIYYDNLLSRLQKQYPDTQYTRQYEAELKSDRFLISDKKEEATLPWWAYLLGGVCLLSLLGNFYFFGKNKKLKSAETAKASLTQQEQTILELILQQKSNKEIAAELFVSVSTVKTHINNIYKKLGVSSRDQVKALYT
ncbi:helix-turn-helix transcriptional regulator [Rasiella rasia]|uniref:Helix-turn-helix transcriptional regulator n=2 Tax=Rasiella rasia TaxID=2744027 RepID=A0A6G6GT89_9FLAO|nr:helix-turn-helix transcriptional regulator [Rasiella rasia]